MSLSIVRAGTWLYGGISEQPFDIISLDYDWWFQMVKAEGQLEENEVPIHIFTTLASNMR